MKSSTIRTMVLGITMLLVMVIGIQVYWLNKAYRLEVNNFNNKVNSALRFMMETIRFSHHDTAPFVGSIIQPQPNFFIAKTKYKVDSDEVAFELKKVIEKFYIFTSFTFGVYDAQKDSMKYVHYISYDDNLESNRKATHLPVLKRSYNYIGVYFPHRETYIIREMSFWVFSTILLLLVIVGFGISLFKLFKQRQLSEIQKDFINNMTHEFRTPISTIQISTEVFQNNPKIRADKRLSQYTNIIGKEINHLESQVDRVLQVANSDGNKIDLKLEGVDVHEVIRDAVLSFEDRIKQKNGRFVVTLQASRPVIKADKLHFINIMFNMIDNALKYANQPEIGLETRDYKSGIHIFVKDNGPGIPEQYQKFLFTKFFRVPTGNLHEVKGFGLGLNYVKTYTKALKGNIKVDSKTGKGTTFMLYFPESSTE